MEHTPPPESKPLPPPAQQPEQPCPRCNSTNTKFCYYNNYSLSQPRYFCKSCRRYWTKGGTLRNVPVGGGCRRKPKPSSRRSDTQFSAVSDTPSGPNFTSLVSFDDLGFNFNGGPQKLADVEFPVLDNSGRFQNNGVVGAGGSQVAGFLDSLRSGSFFEGSSSFGYGSYVGNGGGVCGAAGGFAAEMAVEAFSNVEREGRVLWGFPWQVNSDNGVGSGSDRGSWTELNPAAWHGLLNNTLI